MKTEETITTETEVPKTAAKKSAVKKAARPTTRKASKATAKKKRGGTQTRLSSKAPKATPKKREGTKQDMVLELLRRKEGATTAEIAKATAWQNHSIRGFISGMVTKKMGIAVESAKNEAGDRTYRIIAQ
jgi:hypothetical protein